MIRALFTSATGMAAQQTRIDVIANNLANVNTTGFKRGRAEFEDLLYQVEKTPGAQTATGNISPNGIKVGSGVKTVSVQGIHEQGVFEQTGNPLDVAIEGKGFLQVLLPNGETAYTRSGSLSIDANGKLITQNGYQVLGPSTLGITNVLERNIAEDGTITERVAGSTTMSNMGQIQLATFPNSAGLLNLGRNLFAQTESSGAPTTGIPGQSGLGTIRQGFLEGSNVSIADELVAMITAQRAYELNSRVIRTGDEMLQNTVNIK